MDPAIHPHLPRRQALLFLIAILVPCLLLLALGLRVMAQERRLDVTRRAEQRQLLVGQVRQELLSRLEGIKLQTVTGSTGAGMTSLVISLVLAGFLVLRLHPVQRSLSSPQKSPVPTTASE